jgi:ubiquinone/menaquinone biosynthesis C-methylase UbiE
MTPHLDEKQFAGPEHLDLNYVAGYDNKAKTDPSSDVQHLKDFGLREDSVVVDMGAGTGTFAAAVAPLCKKVIAVDVSEAMIAALKKKVADLGLTNIEVIEAGFLSFEAPPNSIDFVYSRNALHQLPDHLKEIALKKIANMLKPLGVFYLKDLVYSFPKEDSDKYFKAWLDAAPTDPKEGFTREDLERHIKTEFSVYSDTLETMADQAGFVIRDKSHSVSHCFSAYTCTTKRAVEGSANGPN